jgi:TatD DNase family protein
VALSARFRGRVHAAAGIHPHQAGKVATDDLRELSDMWHSGSVVAAGEMGLDYHYDFADRGVQREVFATQLAAVRALSIPVIIHSREAFDDTVGLLEAHGFRDRRVVFHCFTGTAEEAARVAEHGWRISFTGIVTFRNSRDLQAIARAYPLDRLMVETDSPYLSPEPLRGRHPNEPANAVHVARFLSELRGEDFGELCRRTARNTIEFFGLDSRNDE